MQTQCPACKDNYDVSEQDDGTQMQCPGCGNQFLIRPYEELDPDKTQMGIRYPHERDDAGELTMPGKRDRKPDGRFWPGDLIMRRYEVLAELGQGGMGVVYKCFDRTAGIEVALKALPPELSHNTLEMEDIKENFQLVSKLIHQNIAISKNLELDNSNGSYYLIMECIDGEDLRHWIKRKHQDGPLTIEAVLPVVRQIASALDYAHEEKIIHRDIKPGNIMIDNSGHVKVLDFGLAAQIHTSMSRVSMAYRGTSGTGAYMAPEQWRGRVQGAVADQYALAVMTYEMLAGHLPFEATDTAVLREAVLNETAEPIKGVPSSANDAIRRALSKEPAERFASCADFAAALGGKKIRTAQKSSGKKLFYACLAAGIVLLAGAGSSCCWYYLVHQKRLAEKKLKEKMDQQEREMKVFIYKYRSILSQKIQLLQTGKIDRGQTFGEHIDLAVEKFAMAETAMGYQDVESAYLNYLESRKHCEWLDTNSQLRKKAAEQISEAEKKQQDSEKWSAKQFDRLLVENAEKNLLTAKEQWNSAAFENAGQKASAALSYYSQAIEIAKIKGEFQIIARLEKLKKEKNWSKILTEAKSLQRYNRQKADEYINLAQDWLRQENLAELLNQARNAARENKWEDAQKYAEAVLKIDNTSFDAKKICSQAKEHLIPTLKIIAQVDKKEVIAKITPLKTVLPGNSQPYKLETGKEYAFRLRFSAADGTEYSGEIKSFFCDWKGLREYRVALKLEDSLQKQKIAEYTQKAKEFYRKNDYVSAFEYSMKADKSDPVIQFNLAWMYDNGKGCSQNKAEAVKWYQKSANQGTASAQCNLGYMYEFGQGVARNVDAALKWYRKAAENNHAIAQCNLGNMYDNGQGVEKNERTALYWYQKSADQGYASAQYNLGVMYDNGQGVEKNAGTAVYWYRKSADQGHASAQYNLGVMYAQGRGVEKDDSIAVEWYRKSAEQGEASAQCNLGDMYAQGRGVAKDERTAVEWYRKSAENGFALGQCNLGTMYEFGNGVEKNESIAVQWYLKAAENGYDAAQCNLGNMYREGRGVQRDRSEAVMWYRAAAKQNNARAQYFLGQCYENGQGVAENQEEALKLYKLSAKQGFKLAQQALDRLSK